MLYDQSQILSLISHIHSQSQDFLQKELKNLGLKEMVTSHANILFCLSKSSSLTPGELSQKINRDKSTTTALIKKLEKEGFVQLKKDEADSRKKLITLTDQGKKYTRATSELSQKLLQACWIDFDEEQKKQLVELLNKLSSNLA